MENKKEIEVFFDNKRLNLSLLERIIFRTLSFIFLSILTAASFVFLLSDLKNIRWLGAGIILFLFDLFLHRKKGEKNLLLLKLSKINCSPFFTRQSLNILEESFDKTIISGGDLRLHLIKILLSLKEVFHSLKRLEIQKKEFFILLNELINKSQKTLTKKNRKELLTELNAIASLSCHSALAAKNPFVFPSDILSGVINNAASNENVSKLLNTFSITSEDWQKSLLWENKKSSLRFIKKIPASIGGFAFNPFHKRTRTINRAWTSRPTPTLDHFSTDLTSLARNEKIGLLIGHKKEYEEMEDVLSKQNRPNTILIGDPGSGKNAIIAHLAFHILKDLVPKTLFDQRLISLEIENLIAGAPEAEIQNRIKKIIDEITSSKNIILCIENIHNLIKTTNPGAISLADAILPAISSDAFSVIGTTSKKDFKEITEKNSDFLNAFTPIKIEEISEDEAETILIFSSIILENQYRKKISITFPAVKTAVKIAHRYFTSLPLPGSADNLLKEAIANTFHNEEKIVNSDSVISIAEKKINVPLHQIKEQETEKLLNLESLIHQDLIDQEEAVKAVSDCLRQYRSGLSGKNGPIASFLFIGPTGVGKTELSKILTKIQFSEESAMIRLDMSEFQDKQSFFRLIGSPDGHIPGVLTESVSAKPYSLILLDEFEKSHPDILNIFLQVLDDGRLTDNFSHTISFENTIIIATSNANSDYIKEQLDAGKNMPEISAELKKRLTTFFKPELVNRFSRIIAFKNLSLEDIKKIAALQLKKLANNLLERKNISLKFSDPAIDKIATLGYNPSFGARPLKEVIDQKIKNPLAEIILRREAKSGDIFDIDFKEDQFSFIKK